MSQQPPQTPAPPVADGASPDERGGPAASATEVGGADFADFERLPAASPRRRSPLAALAVIGVAAALLIHLAPDLRYAAREGLPVELGPARAIRFDAAGDSSPLRDNTLAATSGLPDYRNALLFEPKGDNYRRSFYRMLGTSSRLWIRAEQTSTRHDLSDRIVGRLRRFDTLPYADQVRAYYATLKITRLLDLAPFQKRSRGEIDESFLGALLDRSGEKLPRVDAGERKATVVVDFPDQLVVTLSKDRFAVEEDARREVMRLGVPVGPGAERADKSGFDYVLRVEPAKRDALLNVLEQRDFEVRVRRERYPSSLAELARVTEAGAGGPGLTLTVDGAAPAFYEVQGDRLAPLGAGTRVVPWERVESIQVDAPVEIPHDAWVLVEGDLPGDYGWAKALAVVLLLFGAANVWLLTRSLRGR